MSVGEVIGKPPRHEDDEGPGAATTGRRSVVLSAPLSLARSCVPLIPAAALAVLLVLTFSALSSAQGVSGSGPLTKPDPFVSRQEQVSRSTNYMVVNQALLARKVQSRPLDRQLCAGISSDYGTSLVSKFLYSQSYRSADETCTLSTQVPCYTNEQQIAAPTNEVYTRFAATLQVSGVSQFRGSVEVPLQFSIDYVAAEGSSTAAGQCATFLLACPPGASCQQLKRITRLEFSVSNVRLGARLVPVCLAPTGISAYGPTSATCTMPASYVAVNEAYSGVGGPPPACEGDVECLDPTSDSCRTTPCEPDNHVSGATVSALLDGNCGPERDPDQGLLAELNQECALATCGACPAVSTGDSQNGVFAAGPPVRAYQAASPSEFLADVSVSVTVTDTSTNTAQTRVVQMTDVGRGEISMNVEGDRLVRVSVLDILGNKDLPAMDVSTGVFMVANYEATASSQPAPFFQQTPDASVNPWREYPNQAVGLTPTATNIAAAPSAVGLTGGWSYLPARSDIGSRPGQYGSLQARLIGPRTQFGTDASCSDGDYYSRHRNIPGWDTGEASANTAGTAGGPPPLVTSPLQCSAILNKVTADLLAGIPPSVWGAQASRCLTPGYNLLAPGDYIADGYFWRQLYDGSEALATPAQELLAAAPDGLSVADYIVGGPVSQLAGNLGRARTAVVLAVDVSEDFVEYGGAASASSISTSGTGCLISAAREGGLATVTVENSDEVNSLTYTVVTECRPYSASRYAVANLSPSTPQLLTVGANSIAQVNPAISFRLVDVTEEGTSLYYPEPADGETPAVCDDSQGFPCATANATIACTFTVYSGTSVSGLPDSTFTALCSDLEPPPASAATPEQPAHVQPTPTPSPTDDPADAAAIGVGAILGVILIAALVIALIGVLIAVCVKLRTDKSHKQKTP